jgi:hypothetical protein
MDLSKLFTWPVAEEAVADPVAMPHPDFRAETSPGSEC